MERSDPEMEKLIRAEMELDRKTRDLAQEYRNAAGDQRTTLKEELTKLVTKQFETRQQRRKLEITRFEEELKRLSDATTHREKNRQPIIEKRVSDLLGEESEPAF